MNIGASPIAALTYETSERTLYWFYSFLTFVLFSTIIDQTLIESHTSLMPQIAVETFFLLNISAGLSGLYFLIKYFIDEKEKNATERLKKEHEALLQRTNELKEANSKLEHLVNHDALTQLPNRTKLAHKLEQAIHHAERRHQQFAVFLSIWINLNPSMIVLVTP
jgi:predicted signal transduction protein with EAL and GGDEF domain